MGELAPERALLSDVVRRLRLSPVLFELGARPHPPRTLYRAYLEQSHIFLGLYWERYGWVAPDMGISGLEDEYRLCADQPKLLYVKEPAPNREPRLTALVEEMWAGNPPPKVFRTLDELADLVANDLALLLSARFGSTRHSEGAPLPVTRPDPVRLRQRPPVPPTPLVGREDELVESISLLMRDDVRLVTLSGPGGIGKSRLAIEIATRLQSEFSGGVIFTRLASIRDPQLVLPTVAAAAGVQTEGNRSALEALVEEFVDKPTLLVLDNFEHVLPAAPDLSALLQECPFLTVLVTSRAVLRLQGEWEHPVPPLTIDDAVRLFTQRAVEARAGTALTPGDEAAVAELCRRLDGLPLAIELAAARSRLLPPAALLRRLGNRLDMLTGGPSDLPERQQTLRSTIDWSYDLLEAEEQLLFARLSVFPGGWTLDSAEAVCGGEGVDDVLGIMSILLERSLIGLADTSEESPRFRMLEVIREYAQERLADAEATDTTARRHAAYLSALAHEAEPHLRDREARRWDALLEAEIGNFRSAVDWLLDRRETVAAVNLVWALSIHLWTADHLVEAGRWASRAHEDEASLDDRGRARLHFLLGAIGYEHGDYVRAITYLREALEGFRAAGDLREQASSLTMLGASHPHFGQADEAAKCLHQAVEILRGIDEPWSLAFALNTLTALVARHDRGAAAVHAAEALDIAERIDNQALVAQALMQLGYLALLGGDTAAARQTLERSLRSNFEQRFREGMANCLDALAAVALREGDPERAATSLGGSEALRESIGAHIWPLLRDERNAIVASASRRLGEPAFTAALQLGRRLSHAELVSRALQAPRTAASSAV